MQQQIQKVKPSLQDKKIILWFVGNISMFYLINDACKQQQVKTDIYILIMGLFMWLSLGPMFLLLTLRLRKNTTLHPVLKFISIVAGWILVLSLFIGPLLAYLAVKNYI